MDAYLALAGALGGTLVTALFAYFQQRGQRKSEEERLDKQLAHERALEDRGYLRAVIEDAAGRFELALDAIVRLSALLEVDAPAEERYQVRYEAAEALEQGRIMSRLLDLRVEFTDPLRTAYLEAIDAIQYAFHTLSDAAPLDAADRWALREHRRAAMWAFASFTSSAREVVGVQVAEG